MKLKKFFLLIFFIIALLVAIACIIAFFYLKKVDRAMNLLIFSNEQEIANASALNYELYKFNKIANSLLLNYAQNKKIDSIMSYAQANNSLTLMNSILKKWEEAITYALINSQSQEQETPKEEEVQELEVVNTIKIEIKNFNLLTHQLYQLPLTQPEEIIRFLNEQYLPLNQLIFEKISEHQNLAQIELENSAKELQASLIYNAWLSLGFIFIVLFITIALSLLIARRIIKKLNLFKNAIDMHFVKGDFNFKLEISNDEFGLLAASFNEMTTDLSNAIAERKEAEADSISLNNQLQVAARRAGMSEIATSVLHNIGNVLSSVNTSIAMVGRKVKSSKMSNLIPIAEMLQQHQKDIEVFLTTDSRGQRLPNYLVTLADEWNNDKSYLLNEIRSLEIHIEHIKDVITKQNSLSTSLGIVQEGAAHDIIEDALKLNQLTNEHTSIKIIKDFAEIKNIQIDRIKLLQILVNLIKNAIESVTEAKIENKEIVLRIRSQDDQYFKIEVIDNGMGISPENKKKLFSHGFTTKKKGHGFGLHSSVLAAKEMEGELSFKSEGPGKGVKFCLILPYVPTNMKGNNYERKKEETDFVS